MTRASPPRGSASVRARQIRQQLRRGLPPEVFRPDPRRGVVTLATMPVALGLAAGVVFAEPPWFVALLVAVVLSQIGIAATFVAHEALHHAVFRSRFLQDVLGWIGFGPYLIGPDTWRAWHNQAHHGATNVPELDPDMLPRRSDYERSRWARVFYHLSVGSSPWAILALPLGFSFQAQMFVWVHSARMPQLRLDRTRARRQSVVLLGGAAVVAGMLGPWAAWWVMGLPLLLMNITFMSYILTNHWLSPAGEHEDPFTSTVSVGVPAWLDGLHWRFSYHQEHHVFPSMSFRHLHRLREEIQQIDPGLSTVIPLQQALVAAWRRPPMYTEDGQGFAGPTQRGGAPVPAAASSRTHAAGVQRSMARH